MRHLLILPLVTAMIIKDPQFTATVNLLDETKDKRISIAQCILDHERDGIKSEEAFKICEEREDE